jgi:tetratricopeptide (TPR) repeat protein
MRARELWNKRLLILDHLGNDLDPEIEQGARTDLLDLAILGAELRIRLAQGAERTAARQEALQILAQAEVLAGPSAVLYYERQAHAEALGLGNVAQEARRNAAACPPRTGWEHYALGRALMGSNQLQSAREQLDRAVMLQPDGIWPNFYKGICSYRLKEYQDASLAFTACIALAPKVAGCFYNRALAYAAQGRSREALRDFDRAIELDNGLAVASLNRGLVHLREKNLLQAEADFVQALENGADPGHVHFDLALLNLARNDRKSAISHLQKTRRFNPGDQQAVKLLDKLQKSP